MTTRIQKVSFMLTLTLLACCAASTSAVPYLDTTNFLVSPANFNGFEAIPNDGTFYTGGSGPYVEGGISVGQINGEPGNDIWVAIVQQPVYALEGQYGWYPNGGDNGYTEITLVGGSDFDAISLIFRAFNVGDVMYDILDDGASVLSGTLAAGSGAAGRIGFAGGGFDTVRLRSGGSSFYDGSLNALLIDSVAADPVPEPASLALLGSGLLGLAARRRRSS